MLLAGEHALHGFTNRVVRQQLARTPYPLARKRKSNPVKSRASSGAFMRTASSPKSRHSRRWRVSLPGRRTMATAIKLREVAYPSLFAAAA